MAVFKRYIPEIFKSKITIDTYQFDSHEELLELEFVKKMKQNHKDPNKKDEYFKRYVLKGNDLFVELINKSLVLVGSVNDSSILKFARINEKN